ncbi:MAG: hypothetical protein MUF49_29090 [Oculatellaceae cyanobacterium Prado106]|nr:hypothetical protein [Oculatellaceae cyanobacterium Prado106]
MKSSEGNISSCKHCQFYRAEGRRGGNCQQLGVPVQGTWKICPLAVPPFVPNWQNLPGIAAWQGFEPTEDPAPLLPNPKEFVALDALELEVLTVTEPANLPEPSHRNRVM